MKFLDRIHTLAFRRQAVTLGGGLIVGWFKDGWSPLDMLGMVALWYLLVFMISVIVGGCYHAFFAGPEDDHIPPENFMTIVSMVMLVFYVGMHMYEKGGVSPP
jgi:hypothetical protein